MVQPSASTRLTTLLCPLGLGQSDDAPDNCGNWETSGILDMTKLFDNHGCKTLLIANCQAHSLSFVHPNVDADLAEGGQVFFLCKKTN